MRSTRRFVANAAMFHFIASLTLLAVLFASFGCREGESHTPGTAAREVERERSASSAAGGRSAVGLDPAEPRASKKSTLVSSWPSEGTRRLSRGEWLQLEFSSPPASTLVESFRLLCDATQVRFSLHAIRPTFFVLNPHGELPANARCFFGWREEGVARRFVFSTAARGRNATIEYDRDVPGLSPPFPDDAFMRADPSRETGLRFAFERFGEDRPLHTFAALLEDDLEAQDGWSPLGHVQIALSDAVDPLSLPHSPDESVHPAAALQWINIDPASPSFGDRVAYHAERREDLAPDGKLVHSLLVHSLLPLRRGGRYALIATRNLRASPERPFEPSLFMQRVLAPSGEGESDGVRRTRRRVRSALWIAEHLASPPIPRDDIALIFRFTVGTLLGVERDLAHVRRQLGVRPPARYSLDRVEAMRDPGDPIEAIVHGTWHAPRWTRNAHFERGTSGMPAISGSAPIPFTLALPRDRAILGAPLVIYQHGNPGSASDEVPIEARRGLAEAGFAVAGFTDVFNRSLSAGVSDGQAAILAQWSTGLAVLQRDRRLPEFWLQTHAEQLAFVRFVETLHDLDVLPARGPDGVPDVDLEASLSFLGVSEGANHAPAFLAFAPEIAAAALVAGGSSIVGGITHQIDGSLAQSFARRALGGHGRDLWLALSLLQTALDRQDPLNLAHLLFRQPIEVADTTRKASILLTAGIYDRRIPNRMTDALAWALGPLPMLAPVTRAVPFLYSRTGPVRGNLTRTTSGAYHQIVPFGVVGAGIEADCNPADLGRWVAGSGHFCVQVAPSAIAERVAFFRSALTSAVPVIGTEFDDAE